MVVVVADELHYRRLLADIIELVGRDEAQRLTTGLSTEELAALKQCLLRQLMWDRRRAS